MDKSNSFMNLSKLIPTFKPHQYFLIVFLIGILCGAVLHYYMMSKTIVWEKNSAYDTGYEVGCEDGYYSATREVIKSFLESDSVSIKPDTIEFYKFEN